MVNNLPGGNKDVGKDLLTYFAATNAPPTKVVHPAELLHELGPKSIRSDALLILTDCGTLPLELSDKIEDFLDRGGTLLTLGGTLFRNPVRLKREVDRTYQGLEWITPDLHARELEKIKLDRKLFDWSGESARLVERNTNDSTHPTVYGYEEDSRFGTVLHGAIEDLDGWDSWISPPVDPSPKESHTYTSFYAKGGPKTTRLAVEWREKDGSRWFATVPLGTEWRRYLLPQSDFEFWESVPNRKGSGLNLSNGERISFGMALSHTGHLTGDHDFWVAEVGVTGGEGVTDYDWTVGFPPHELLYPHYVSYTCSDVGRIKVRGEQALVPPTDGIRVPRSVQAYPPRPRSMGWGETGRNRRWIPLLVAESREGDFRGEVAALRFDRDIESMWAAFSIEDPEFYRQKEMLELIRKLAIRMMQGDFIWEAGAKQSTYFPGDSIQFGATVCHRNSPYGETFLRMTISEVASGRVIYLRDHPKGKFEIHSASTEQLELQSGTEYLLTSSLIQDEKQTGDERVLDRVEQPLTVWSPDTQLEWVTARDGEFQIGGASWKPYGVNYMPSSGIGLHDWEAFEYWLEPKGYDPLIIERDLSRIRSMGMNMVSVFLYHRSIEHRNLIDFLYRCEKLGLRVNLSLRPGTPLDFPWPAVKEMIQINQLDDIPTVFAYDLAWEPNFRNREQRREHREDWNQWVIDRHGSLHDAIEFWGFDPESQGDSIDVPASEQWYRAGEWDLMLADYSEFINGFLGQRYADAREQVKSIAPRQLVSFRMQHTGDPTHRGPEMIPYPAEAFVDAVDIFEPEAYGRIGNWERIRPGQFTADYLRALNPDLPVFWAEIGRSCWDRSEERATDEEKQRVADYYEDFHKMLIDSHANGVAFWWYAGGYRVNERSDYGILNPDGTDRPVTQVIREWGPRFLESMGILEPEVWIDMEKGWTPGGIVGQYDRVQGRYWNHIEDGKEVGLRFLADKQPPSK